MSTTADQQSAHSANDEKETKNENNDEVAKEKGSSYEGDFFKDFYNSQGDYDDSSEKGKDKGDQTRKSV